MKLPESALRISLLGIALLFFISNTYAQTKQLKRPKNKAGISSVDNFVTQSFDLYDKVYKYDGYAAAGTPLEDEDIDVLEDALDDLQGLSESAPDILGDIDGASVLKQTKATLQINKAKKALIKVYKISGDRLQTDGKGETEPVDDNSTNNGKAQNRRVEFVKI